MEVGGFWGELGSAVKDTVGGWPSRRMDGSNTAQTWGPCPLPGLVPNLISYITTTLHFYLQLGMPSILPTPHPAWPSPRFVSCVGSPGGGESNPPPLTRRSKGPGNLNSVETARCREPPWGKKLDTKRWKIFCNGLQKMPKIVFFHYSP